MPELPDLAVYREALEARIVGQPLARIRLANPFVLRTAVPPIADAEGRRVLEVRRMGKRIVLALDGELFLVLHLMIAGRLRWLAASAKPPARITLARLRVRDGHARAHRGGDEAARVAAPRARRGRARPHSTRAASRC